MSHADLLNAITAAVSTPDGRAPKNLSAARDVLDKVRTLAATVPTTTPTTTPATPKAKAAPVAAAATTPQTDEQIAATFDTLTGSARREFLRVNAAALWRVQAKRARAKMHRG